MYKCKIFMEADYRDLEWRINNWLKEMEKVKSFELCNVTYSERPDNTSALVIYFEVDEED